jgi:ectoine hydroxylase-related dioxygenase (phytanoyl-CoA dioxygenase family)
MVEITDHQSQQFRDEGYFILERVLPHEVLESLRRDCSGAIREMNRRIDAGDPTVSSINHRDQRYFIPFRYEESSVVRTYVFSDLMAAICRATIGDEAYLFLDQHVVKAPGGGMRFGWHQDSGYVGFEHTPYLTTWTALDDMDERVGTIHLLPFSRAGGKEVTGHIREEGSNDMIGYFGDDPGITAAVPAGSVVVFSSLTFHCSGANQSDRWRRSFLAQYTPAPQRSPEGKLTQRAEPFLRGGQRVARL